MKALTRVSSLVLFAATLAISNTAFAGTTWDGGGGDSNWGTGANWNDNLTPPTGTTVDLTFAGSTRLDPNNNYTAWDNFRSIYFASGAGAFTITGNPIDFYDGKIENNSSSSQSLNITDFSFNSGSQEVNPVSGNLTLGGGGNIYNNGLFMDVYGNNGYTLTLSKNLQGTGGVSIKQDSRVLYTVSMGYTGNTEIDAGQLRLGASGDISASSAIYLGNGGATTTDAKFFLNTDANGKTFSRTINVNPGDGTSANREIGFLSATTSDVGTFSGNIVRATGGDNRGVTLYSAGAKLVLSGVLSGDDVVILSGPGVVEYQNGMTSTGDTSIRMGELRIAQGASIAGGTIFVGDSGLPTDTATLTISDANGGTTVSRTLQVNNGSGAQYRVIGGSNTSGMNTFSGGLTLQGFAQLTAATGGTVEFGGIISQSGGTYGITKVGSGTVRLSNANTYAGQTSIDAGTLQLGASDRISDSSALYIAGGATLDLNSFTEEVGNFVASAGNVTNLVSGQQFRVNQTGNSTYSGSISGTGAFVKKGTADLTLSGVNSYTGSTFIDAGELRYAANQAAGYSGTINLGATTGGDSAVLSITNAGVTITNPITVRSNGTGARSIIARNTSGLTTFSGDILVSNVLNITATSGGNLTLGGDITMHAHNITNNTSSTTTFAGQIDGTGKIVKQGTGTLTLGGNNLYTGNTEIDQGTLAVTGDIANGSTTYIGNGGAGFSSANATLTLGANGVDLGGPVQVNTSAGSGTRTIDSTATSGNTTISGNVTVNRDVTLQTGSGSDLTVSGNMTGSLIQGVTVTGSDDVTISGALVNLAALTKNGTGTLTLSGSTANNQVSTIVNSGTLQLNKTGAGLNSALGSTVTIGDGTGGANADVVKLLASNQLSDTASPMINSSGLLHLNGFSETIGGLQGNGNVNLAGGNLTFNSGAVVTFSGAVTGTGDLTKNGASVQTLSGVNSYSGDTIINAGILRVGANNALPTGTDVILANAAGATFDLDGNSQQIASLSGGGASGGNVTLVTGQLTVNQSGNTTYGGVISGSGGSVTKSGSGRITLTGINTYTGATLINAGSITVNSGAALSASSAVTITNSGNLVVNGTVGNVTINNGGFLKGSGTVGTLAVNSGGSFSPGNSPGTMAAGNTTWNNGGSYIWELNDVDAGAGTDPGWDLLDVTGTLTVANNYTIYVTSLTLGNTSGNVADFNTLNNYQWVVAQTTGGVLSYTPGDILLNLSGFSNPYGGTWSVSADASNVYVNYTGGPLDVSVVPEPSMAILLLLGGGVIYARRRRSRRA
ncbi:MAG: hypothetical protein PCFJNLEI_03651 [Verrucomicrobiae bacterium]|nr:hypothetical protein [Verrucomicrobiae bacterium]